MVKNIVPYQALIWPFLFTQLYGLYQIIVYGSEVTNLEWTYPARAELMRNIVKNLMSQKLPVFIEDCPDVSIIYYENSIEKEGLVTLVNGNPDDFYPQLVVAKGKLRPVGKFNLNSKMPGLSTRFFRLNWE